MESVFDFGFPDEYTYDTNYVTVQPFRLRIRRRNASGRWAPDGTCALPTDRAGVVTTPVVTLHGVQELFGFEVSHLPSSEGEIRFRISCNGGDHWWWWDGVQWSPVVGPDDFTPEADFVARIGSFPFVGPKNLRLQMRLVPTPDGTGGPEIQTITYWTEVRYNFFEDVRRTLMRHVQDNLAIDQQWGYSISEDTDEVVIQGGYEVLDVLEVFNLSTDPSRSVNLYDYRIGPTTIKMTGVQSAGDNILISYVGRCKVYLSADANYFYSEIPAVVILLPEMAEYRAVSPGHGQADKDPANRVYRVRRPPVYRRGDIIVYSGSAIDAHATDMSDAVMRLLAQAQSGIRSLSTGQAIQIVDLRPWRTGDNIKTGIYQKSFAATVFASDYSRRGYEVSRYTERVVIGTREGMAGRVATDPEVTVQ